MWSEKGEEERKKCLFGHKGKGNCLFGYKGKRRESVLDVFSPSSASRSIAATRVGCGLTLWFSLAAKSNQTAIRKKEMSSHCTASES